MDLLLDTHTFLWFSEDNPVLSNNVKSKIENEENNCLISMASIWEMAIKISLGKLKIKIEFKNLLDEITTHNFSILPIVFEHTIILTSLPFHHRDPFDRLLAAQAIVENLTLISTDEIFDKYGMSRIW